MNSARDVLSFRMESGETTIGGTVRSWARRLKRDALTVWLLARDPRAPWHVKALALCVAGYAFSPIDLIPDFIPVLGYLDDLIIVPLGLWLVVRLTPPALVAELREEAEKRIASGRPVSHMAAAVIVAVWVAAACLVIYLAVG
jgi:uncharacterized membrane protein YkvA (DUF1232 family)